MIQFTPIQRRRTPKIDSDPKTWLVVELKAKCDELGISYNTTWNKKRFVRAVEAAMVTATPE